MSDTAMNLKLALARMHFAMFARDADTAATWFVEAKHLADALIQN